MCISDLRLGRLVTSVVRTIVVTHLTTLTIPASRQRIGIAFGIAASSVVNGGDIRIDVDRQQLLLPTLITDLFRYSFETDGNLPTKEWGIVNLATVTDYSISVVEHFLPEDVLRAYINQFEPRG